MFKFISNPWLIEWEIPLAIGLLIAIGLGILRSRGLITDYWDGFILGFFVGTAAYYCFRRIVSRRVGGR